MTTGEFIFSHGNEVSNKTAADNITRVSGFFNWSAQRHYNFNARLGLYSGAGVRNIGLIGKLPTPENDDVKIKQRAYALGIPLALKLGDMVKGNYLALGAEMEYMLHYKRKIFYRDGFSKSSDWFPSQVRAFSPSLFTEIRFHNGTFLRFRYYIFDFLTGRRDDFFLPETGVLMPFSPDESRLFYFSIGTAFKVKRKKPLTKNDV